MENKKIVTILVLATTVVLAGIALFTALKLYQLGQEPSPSIKPKAKIAQVSPSPEEEIPLIAAGDEIGICEKVFNITSVSPSPSPSQSPGVSPSPSPSQSPGVSPSPSTSPEPECWEECSYDSDCPRSLVCQNISGTYRCVNYSCPAESDCVCAGTTVSPSPSPSYQATVKTSPSPATIATQELPEAGLISPTVIFSVGGIALLLLGILL